MRLPDIIHYKFYGCGIPKSRAIRFLTIHAKAKGYTIGKKSLMLHFAVKKQRYAGILLVQLLLWLHRFVSAKDAWFQTLEETEYL